MPDDIFEDINKFLRESPEPDEPDIPLITEEQTEALIMSLALGRDKDGFNEEEVANLLIWAHQVIFNQSLLNLILKGHVWVSTQDNELLKPDASNMTVILSDIGRAAAKRLDIE